MSRTRKGKRGDADSDPAKAGVEPAGSGDSNAELSFEEGLASLEAVVAQLENGDLELEEALAAFEQGVALTRRCSAQLERSERRIEELIERGGESLERPFEPGES